MSTTTAVRRTAAVLLATLLAVVAYHTAVAPRAKAEIRPSVPGNATSAVEDKGKSHRPVISSGVKFVRNDDGSVSRTR